MTVQIALFLTLSELYCGILDIGKTLVVKDGQLQLRGLRQCGEMAGEQRNGRYRTSPKENVLGETFQTKHY